MDPDEAPRGRLSDQAAASKSRRREKNRAQQRERGRGRGRFPPLRLISTSSAAERHVLAVLPCPAPPPGAASADGAAPVARGPPAPCIAPAPSLQPLAAPAVHPPPELLLTVRGAPAADQPAQAPLRRSVLDRLGPPVRPGILPDPASAASARSATIRARPAGTADLDGSTHERRVRCRELAAQITARATPPAHLEGRQAQAEFRAEQARAPFSFAQFAVDPVPSPARHRTDLALDNAVEAITAAVCNRLAERQEAPRWSLPIPRPPPQRGAFGPPEAPHPLPAEAALQHPEVVQRLQACHSEIIRLRYSLVAVAGTESGRRINLNAGGVPGGPDPGHAPAPAPVPPPWSGQAGRP